MRPLTEREKRTVRWGAIGLVAYLTLFFGVQTWNGAARRRGEYRALQAQATALGLRVAATRDKAEAARDLMERFRMDPSRLSVTSLVAEATAALHAAATGNGLQLGPIRETPARAAARELTAVQMEGVGPVPAILKFLHQVGSLGYPLVTDSVEVRPESRGPGQLRITLTVVILDFDQWKTEEGGRPDA